MRIEEEDSKEVFYFYTIFNIDDTPLYFSIKVFVDLFTYITNGVEDTTQLKLSFSHFIELDDDEEIVVSLLDHFNNILYTNYYLSLSELSFALYIESPEMLYSEKKIFFSDLHESHVDSDLAMRIYDLQNTFDLYTFLNKYTPERVHVGDNFLRESFIFERVPLCY